MSANPWYAWYVGDARAKMRRLSLAEKGAYRELLDEIYATREPLPADLTELCRIAGAATPEECAAVGRVVKRFFPLDGDGTRHNKRADLELARQAEFRAEQSRKGKLSAQQRFNRGLTVVQPEGQPEVNRGVNLPQPQPQLQPQTTTTQEKNNVALAMEILQFLNQKTQRHYRPVNANLDLIIARLKDGATEQELRQVIAKKSREWLGDDKMQLYLRPATLFNRTKFAQYQGELCNAPIVETH